MYKSGLILGVVALLVAAGATLLSPLCTPCAAVFLGLGAGFLAGVFDKPSDNNATVKAGAIGGTIGGVGAILGQIMGTVLNGVLVGPERLQQFNQQLGLPLQGAVPHQTYWLGLIGGGICFSLLDVLLMAGFGALGGLIWWQTTGKNTTRSAPTMLR